MNKRYHGISAAALEGADGGVIMAREGTHLLSGCLRALAPGLHQAFHPLFLGRAGRNTSW